MFIEGQLTNTIITESQNEFPLKGMICPTFQNTGDAFVLIDGIKVASGESYAINAPCVILTNSISVVFENDPLKSRILHIGYVQTTVKTDPQ